MMMMMMMIMTMIIIIVIRTPSGPRQDPVRTPSGPRQDPVGTPSGPRQVVFGRGPRGAREAPKSPTRGVFAAIPPRGPSNCSNLFPQVGKLPGFQTRFPFHAKTGLLSDVN